MREPNEIDFWRGFALVTIFINHIPGLWFEKFTPKNFALSDSAELFVFLAGWGLRCLVMRFEGPSSTGPLVLRLYGRAFTLYAAQLVMTAVAVAMLSAASLYWAAPDLLEWNNASAAFRDPVAANLGMALLTYQLNYFDILPLYIVLMVGAPLMVVLHRLAPMALLPVSLAIYLIAFVTGTNFPAWPSGVWFFNPLSWQLVYVLGYVLAGNDGLGALARRNIGLARMLALPVLIAGALIMTENLWPPPEYGFLFDKTFQGPVRLMHYLAVATFFAGSFWIFKSYVPPVARYLSLLGRNSLHVFCVGSLLSLAGQIWLRFNGPDLVTDTLLLLVGLTLMGLVAWIVSRRPQRAVSAA